MKSIKHTIAERISSGYCWYKSPTYNQLIESAYDNLYVCMLKCPVEIFMQGTLNSYVLNDLMHANQVFKIIKEVVIDILEVSGCEATFVDADWDKLHVIPGRTGWDSTYAISIDGITVYNSKKASLIKVTCQNFLNSNHNHGQ